MEKMSASQARAAEAAWARDLARSRHPSALEVGPEQEADVRAAIARARPPAPTQAPAPRPTPDPATWARAIVTQATLAARRPEALAPPAQVDHLEALVVLGWRAT